MFGATFGTGGTAEASRIDEADRTIGCLDDRVDGIAGRPRHVVHHRALLAEQLVEQGRLAHVGAADDGHTRRPTGPGARGGCGRLLLFLGRNGRGKKLDHGVEEVAGAAPVQGAHGEGVAHAEGDELPGGRFAVRVVDLVHHQADRWSGPADDLGRGEILVRDPGRHVDDEEDDIGLGQGSFGLLADLGRQRVTAGQPAAGVHDGEGHTGPFGREDLAVAGDPRFFLDDSGPLPHNAVDQGGFAHIGAPGYHDHREFARRRAGRTRVVCVLVDGVLVASLRRVLGLGGHAAQADRNGVPSRAARNELPSVGTTSTGRGRSARVRPSRNRPSFRHASGRRYRVPPGLVSRARATSSPVRRPATPMLPPKKSLAISRTVMSSRGWSSTKGRRMRAP